MLSTAILRFWLQRKFVSLNGATNTLKTILALNDHIIRSVPAENFNGDVSTWNWYLEIQGILRSCTWRARNNLQPDHGQLYLSATHIVMCIYEDFYWQFIVSICSSVTT